MENKKKIKFSILMLRDVKSKVKSAKDFVTPKDNKKKNVKIQQVIPIFFCNSINLKYY
jgi:hypothetical protein